MTRIELQAMLHNALFNLEGNNEPNKGILGAGKVRKHVYALCLLIQRADKAQKYTCIGIYGKHTRKN